MLTLPPAVSQPAQREQVALYEPVSYIEPVAHRRQAKAPLVAILVSVMIFLIGVFYWVVH